MWRISAAFLGLPDTRKRLANEGAAPVASKPDDFAAFVQAEIRQWSEVGRAAKIQPVD